MAMTPEQQKEFEKAVAQMDLENGAGDNAFYDSAREELIQKLRERYEAVTGIQNEIDQNQGLQYGGSAEAGAEFKKLQRDLAMGAQNREGVQIDYKDANTARDYGFAARRQQMGMADLMAARARGETPSIAQMMADRNMGQAVSAQNSLAASARGPAALALAQQQAAGNASAAQSAISNQAQINAANERLQAEQAAFGAYSGMRQGDAAAQGMAAQQAQAQGQLSAQQRALNDQMTQAMLQGEHATNVTQSQIEQNKVALKAGQQQATLQNRWADEERKREQTMGMFETGAKAFGTVATMTSDERVKAPVTWGVPSMYEQPDVISGGRMPATVEAAKEEAKQALEAKDRGGPPQWLQEYAKKEGIDGGTPTGDGDDKKKDDDEEKSRKKNALGFSLMALQGAGAAIGQALAGPRRPRPTGYVPQMQQITSGMETKEALPYMTSGMETKQSMPYRSMSPRDEYLTSGMEAKQPLTYPSDERAKVPVDYNSPRADSGGIAAAWGADIPKAYEAPQRPITPRPQPQGDRPQGGAAGAAGGYGYTRQFGNLYNQRRYASPAAAAATTSQSIMGQRLGNQVRSASSAQSHGAAQLNNRVQAASAAPAWDQAAAEHRAMNRAASGIGAAVVSDERAKDPLPLYEPEGQQLHVGADGRGYLASEQQQPSGPSLSGPTPKYSSGEPMPESETKAKAPRKLTPDELRAAGESMLSRTETQRDASLARGPAVGKRLSDEELKALGESMLATTNAQKQGSLSRGPAVGDRDKAAPLHVEADAARRLAGHPYRYKPGFGEPTDQVHYGPNAQELEKNPITRTAVTKGPDGVRRLDTNGLHRVEMSTIGALQEQLDEQKSIMAQLLARRRR